MRRIVMMMAVTAALLALGATAVFAQEGQPSTAEKEGSENLVGAEFTGSSNQTIQCTGVPCIATGNRDLVYERIGNRKKDRIILKGGDDQVRANTYHRDRDVIKGSAGFDLIYVDDGDTRDRIFGGKGNDKCYVDARSEVVSGCSVIIVQ
jgi:hypothetical protein